MDDLSDLLGSVKPSKKVTESVTLTESPLAPVEGRLRSLLPSELYVKAWMEPSTKSLMEVFNHLRTLKHILADYVPRQLSDHPATPGHLRYSWQEGTLMFTDLAGFTQLMEAYAPEGREGANEVMKILNRYFAAMLEVVSKSGGELLEFTGDAMLIQFPRDRRATDTVRAIKAALRMQHAMHPFKDLQTHHGTLILDQRIGIHVGRYLSADIGTPHRMDHVLLGKAVRETKVTEGAGLAGRVNLTDAAYERVKDQFRFEDNPEPGYKLIIDDLDQKDLGEYDITLTKRRSSTLMFDRSIEGLVKEIEEALDEVEPLACFIPAPILELLVENAVKREVPPDFPAATVMFVNLIGMPEAVDAADEAEVKSIVTAFSRLIGRINAAVEKHGGMVQRVTYHLAGSDLVILFGVPTAHTDDPHRATRAALEIREIMNNLEAPVVGGKSVEITCQIGMNRGTIFSGEIGEPRGRRQFNIQGDSVNLAARLMGKAIGGRILMSEELATDLKQEFELQSLGSFRVKGKSEMIRFYALHGLLSDKPTKSPVKELLNLFD